MFLWTRRKFSWQPCQKLSVKDRSFFMSNSKNDDKPNVHDLFSLTFFLCTFRLLFRDTQLLFLPKSVNLIQGPRKMVIIEITFIIFSHSFAEDTWNALLATCRKFFAKRRLLSLTDRKHSSNYSSFKKKIKRSAGHASCSFEKITKKITPKVQ